jgi:isoleucyl-tRNA synthetase
MFRAVSNNVNFPELEKEKLSHWYGDGVVDKYLKKNRSSKKYFSFLDGPITANNPMGVHHAWGRTYKDLWPRFFNLLGYRQRFQSGFDCQGLWVEVEVEKELKIKNKKEIENLVPGDKKKSIAKFVQLCKDRVNKYAKIQTEQSKRLGYFADWEHSYFTMSDENNYMIWLFLKKCYENGWVYKGHESVPWCPRCETAISQHEMLTEDYKEVTHESIYLKLPIIGQKKEFLVVWTTTPWTIPANIAVAVDEKLDYSLVQDENGDLLWVAKEVVESLFAKKTHKVVKTVKGKALVGFKYRGPFDDLEAVAKVAADNPDTFHRVIPTDDTILPISITEGTGLVHTAVSAGVEDFKLGKKLGLPMIPVIADNADYLSGLGAFSGKNAKKNPRLILDYLEKGEGWVFKIENYTHRYPACWRCKHELVWKVADEWYISMDVKSKQGRTFREMMIGVAKKIKWLPEFGLERELDWLKNMHDWLISKKNRYWGLALPIYECGCGHFEVIGSKKELKERSVVGWEQFEGRSPHKPYIDDIKIKCSKCGRVVSRIDDVGNPWLDAGIVAYSTVKENNQGEPLYLTDKKEWSRWIPANFITESFPGQFKNWFYALIAMSTVMEDLNPFGTVLGYGTLTGEDGRPMHKSWGNSIEFNEGADKIGVDVMRWLFVRHNPAENLPFGYKKADEVRRQFYLVLWNSYKFFVDYANLDKPDLSDARKILPDNVLDAWLINRLVFLKERVESCLKGFNAKDASLEIEKFVSDLSTWYIRRSRNRLWVNSNDLEDKAGFYNTLYTALVNLSVMISPFMPFISDEIYVNLTGKESVHLDYWPDIQVEVDDHILTDMELVRQVVEVGRRVRKEIKIKTRQPLSLSTIFLPENRRFLSKKFSADYEKLIVEELNVKKIIFKSVDKDKEITVEFDTRLSPELVKEGKLRDLIRQIQEERKKMAISPEKKIRLTVPEEFENFKKQIIGKVACDQLVFGPTLKVEL